MGDLASRPRGGWQVGGRRFGSGRPRGPYSEDFPDPAPDVYEVERLPECAFLVHHYPNADADRPCCVVKVSRKRNETELDVLARAYAMCEQRHETGEVKEAAA